ncbi:DUF305 domain-containing protein [Acetobacteraceae bacterium H6797]|nr:DUF305 domain-containing protein [Acetobacteraceae bacterium H6797]
MRSALPILFLLASTLPVAAQHAGHAMPSPPPSAAASPSTQEFQAANQRMHQGMNIPYTGDADRDFAAGMIPHHQGAIDMARIELKYGKDPAMRQLAEAIIAAQEKEIAELQAFLAKRR